MDREKIFIASLCAMLLLLIQANSIIACENEEDEAVDENNGEECSNSINTFFGTGTLLDKLIERYPILDTIIQMILEMIHNFLLRINLPS